MPSCRNCSAWATHPPSSEKEKGTRNKENGKSGTACLFFFLFPFAFFLAAMPTDPATWSEYLRRTLQCYDEPLLRQVVGRLCRPRNQWPAAELIERSLNTLQNPAVLDRRIGDLSPAGRQLLALIGHSR